jgi:hypothetical protein
MVTSEEDKTLTFRRWHAECNTLLISLGIHGSRQSEIVKHFNEEPAEDVVAYLEMLLKEDKAQKFIYNRNPYWRATVNILEEEYRKG